MAQTSGPYAQAGLLEFYFEAGDDYTDPQILTLVPRPSVESVRVTVAPPAYAADPPKIDGQIILSGYGRYRTGKVKPPAPIGSF